MMQRPVKKEPVTEQPKWRLVAVSQAARKLKNMIVLEPKTYTMGRSRNSDIHIASPFCSVKHCELLVTDMEVIMRDESTHGTNVNGINYKKSRCILSNGDRLGFGCTVTSRHINDVNDYKYHVYRLSNENELLSSDTIELLDSSDDETENTASNRNGRANILLNNEDSEDECASADEMDVKPDIHALMRKVQEGMKIKEEVAWNCHEYDRSLGQNQENDVEAPVDNVDLDTVEDNEAEICVIAPPQKRQRIEPTEFGLLYPDPPATSEHENGASGHVGDVPQPEWQQDVLGDRNLNVASEYQMSDTTLKEKVKLVVRSRGQQLATDMLIAAQAKGQPKGAINAAAAAGTKATKPSAATTSSNKPMPSTSKAPIKVSPPPEIPSTYKDDENAVKSVEDLKNDFISEITKWDYKWINDRNLNPLQYKMNIRHLDTDFTDLHTFQQQMKNFLLMETYSIIFTEYCLKTLSAHTFTEVTSCFFDPSIKRFVYKCFTKQTDCRVEHIRPNDFAVLTSSKKGRFLAYVTQSKRTAGGWEFELQASPVDNNRNDLTNSKFIQVTFVTNIQAMLENFISLYELRQSMLLDVFLRPSTQFDDSSANLDFTQKHYLSIVDKMYEKCAVSVFGGSQILLLNGGVGTGKTAFIRHLLFRFATENFQITNSILVCGRTNPLVDAMAAKMMNKIKSTSENIITNRAIIDRVPDFFARFGKFATMKRSVREIGVEMFNPKLQTVNVVFTTLDNAIDLLHTNRTFDVCIVDDASLCAEAELLPLFRLNITTLLLVGDEALQTSTTQNECCRENGYSRSLFTRVIESYRTFEANRTFFPTLYRQRRMHPDIQSWPNKTFYRSAMLPLENPSIKTEFWPYTVLQVNTIEDIEVSFVSQLLEFCVQVKKPSTECTYGIICGHPQSKEELENMIKNTPNLKGIEVSDYDSFQGREKDIIIMVALKPIDGFTLFGTKENLLIALTRAKQTLILCGNFQHVLTNVDEMSSKWSAIISDARIRERFFDLNGTFDVDKMFNLIR